MYTLKLWDITGATAEYLFSDAVVKGWSNRISAPGRMVFTLPAGSAGATDARLRKYKQVTLERRKQDGSGADEGVWRGYIEAHKRTSEAEFTVYCVGLLQLFRKRFTAANETFTG